MTARAEPPARGRTEKELVERLAKPFGCLGMVVGFVATIWLQIQGYLATPGFGLMGMVVLFVPAFIVGVVFSMVGMLLTRPIVWIARLRR